MKRTFLVVLGLCALGATARAQERQISGRVTTAQTGDPVGGVRVAVTGTGFAAVSKDDGRYTIAAPPAAVTLVFRRIGYKRREVAVPADQNTADVTLELDVFNLEAVVVTGQATDIARRNAAMATTQVSGADVARVPSPTLDRALQGKVPGAIISQNSGAPGGGTQVQLRGNNTIVGSPDPLFVVDGVIYSDASLPSGLFTVTKSSLNRGNGELQDDPVNRLADLNTSDVASVDVLRGAAASSIYGSKAANGVIIVTTKRGQSGKPRANITQRLGFFELLRGPAPRVFTDASALDLYARTAADTAFIRSFEVGGQLPVFDHTRELAGGKPLASETQLDVSGGAENTRYFLSGSAKYDGGIINNTNAGRQTLRANVDQGFSDRWQLSVSTQFNRTATARGFTNNDNSGASVTYAIAYIPSFISMTPSGGAYPQPAITYLGSNPLQTTDLGHNDETAIRFTGGGTLTFQAVTTARHTLKFVGAGGIDFFSQKNKVFSPPELYFEKRLANPGTATVSNAESRQWNWNVNAIHAYTPASGSFRATTSAGVQVEDRELDRFRVTAHGLLPGQQNIDEGSVFGQQLELNSKERTLAFYGQEEVLSMDERLLVAAGLRAERSSANGDTRKYYVFPKGSVSYRLPGLLGEGSELKLRGDYGETGNQAQFGQKFTTLNTSVIGGSAGTVIGTVAGSPSLRPERVKEFEAGFDATVWNGRATFEVTGYTRHTHDLLVQRTPAPSSGVGVQIFNGGTLWNEGIELAAGVTPLQRKDLSWLFRTTFTSLKNRVQDLPVPDFRPANAGYGLAYGEFFIQRGRPISQIIGTDTLPGTGGATFVRYLGQANPRFRMSFSNDVTYKRASLSMLWEWQAGGAAQNQTLSLYDCNGLAPDQDTPIGKGRFDACNTWGIAVPFIQSTTFLKLREASVAVDLPEQIAAWFGAHNARVSVTGRNLLLFTKYFGYDPEVSNYGQQAVVRNIDLGPYPPARSFFFTISAGF